MPVIMTTMTHNSNAISVLKALLFVSNKRKALGCVRRRAVRVILSNRAHLTSSLLRAESLPRSRLQPPGLGRASQEAGLLEPAPAWDRCLGPGGEAEGPQAARRTCALGVRALLAGRQGNETMCSGSSSSPGPPAWGRAVLCTHCPPSGGCFH